MLRRALTEAEPGLPVYDLAPLDQRVARSLAQDAIVAQLTSVFGFIALLLACLGLYGTISYGVTRRSPELGLRIALGADRIRVLWLILREALVLIVVGGMVGLPLTYAAGRGLETLLYVVGPMDPVAYAVGAIVLMAVGVLAAFLPALRASRIEPMTALGRG
jgi:ABC-type antimicrobial peptide transport system permease subunit